MSRSAWAPMLVISSECRVLLFPAPTLPLTRRRLLPARMLPAMSLSTWRMRRRLLPSAGRPLRPSWPASKLLLRGLLPPPVDPS